MTAKAATETKQAPGRETLALVLLFIVPAMFATNMLVARAAADTIPPWAMAFLRWTGAAAILLPFVGRSLWRNRAIIRREWVDLLVLGALGMGVCGAFVYIGGHTTTATNIGVIYSISPVMIVLLAAIFYREHMTALQGLGVAACLIGVLAIILKGDPSALLRLEFVVGDLWILGSAAAWAIYSIILRFRPGQLDMWTRFLAIILGGVAVLMPVTLWENFSGNPVRWSGEVIAYIALLSVVTAVGAYSVYAYILGVLGAGRTGLIMYMIPVYNAGLAWLISPAPPWCWPACIWSTASRLKEIP